MSMRREGLGEPVKKGRDERRQSGAVADRKSAD
jgi:hypothetical protein